MDWQTCEIVYVVLEEKWGIFPREIAQFRALVTNSPQQEVLAKSAKFELEKFNTMGPNEKNKKHKAAWDSLVDKLTADGWERCGQGELWFHLFFRRQVQV